MFVRIASVSACATLWDSPASGTKLVVTHSHPSLRDAILTPLRLPRPSSLPPSFVRPLLVSVHDLCRCPSAHLPAPGRVPSRRPSATICPLTSTPRSCLAICRNKFEVQAQDYLRSSAPTILVIDPSVLHVDGPH
jgi:hypothetical protein